MTQSEREKLFREDFENLLKKHGAEYDVTTTGGYFPSPVCIITQGSRYDEYGELLDEYTEFHL